MAKSSKVSIALAAALGSPLSAERIAAQASITSALSVAVPTHKIAAAKPGKGAAYELIPFTSSEKAVFVACLAVERAAWETDNRRVAVAVAVRAHFGETAPTYAQYKALQTALELQAIEAGYTGQMMRKHCAHAVKATYGALPESDSPAAIAKRAQRPGKTVKPAKVEGAAETFAAGMAHAQSAESIESFIARVGIVATLAALNRILEAEESTKDAAHAVADVIPMLAS